MSRAGLWEVLKCVPSEVVFQLVLCRGQCHTECSTGAHGLCIVAWWGVGGGGGGGGGGGDGESYASCLFGSCHATID